MLNRIKMSSKENRENIIDVLINKAAVKQDIADYSKEVFISFKRLIQDEIIQIKKEINDKRIRLRFEEQGSYEFRLFIGSDLIVFQLHTNIFRLPDKNQLWKEKYLFSNPANGYFGIINIYNFLAESYEKNRFNDIGYLIGRIFMNHDNHFMVDGQGELGTKFRDLKNSVISDDIIRKIIQTAIMYAIDFDLITPPYEIIKEVSLGQIKAISSDLQLSTGKSMGFKFSNQDSEIV